MTRSMKFNGAPVLFVHGNRGSYRQARSLASVALRKGIDNNWTKHLDYFTGKGWLIVISEYELNSAQKDWRSRIWWTSRKFLGRWNTHVSFEQKIKKNYVRSSSIFDNDDSGLDKRFHASYSSNTSTFQDEPLLEFEWKRCFRKNYLL